MSGVGSVTRGQTRSERAMREGKSMNPSGEKIAARQRDLAFLETWKVICAGTCYKYGIDIS